MNNNNMMKICYNCNAIVGGNIYQIGNICPMCKDGYLKELIK